VHTAGFDDESNVWRLVDVWDTREQADRFMERMMEMVKPEELPRPDTATQEPSRPGLLRAARFREELVVRLPLAAHPRCAGGRLA
jgi:hypothetical protein